MKPGPDDDDDDDDEELLHKDMAHRHNHHHGGIKAEDKDEDYDDDDEEDDDDGKSEEDMNKKQQQQESEEEEEEGHKRKQKHKHKEKYIKHSHHLDKDITHYPNLHDDHNDHNHHEYMSPGPCAACKFLRRKCVKGCVFAPYFLSEQGTEGFCAVHKVFGASNVSKLLSRIGLHEQRQHAVLTIQYEAQARLLDPVYGCVRIIFSLQQQVQRLQAELEFVRSQLSTCHHQMQQLLLGNTGGFGVSTPLTTIGNNYPSFQLPQYLIEENMQHTSNYDSQCIPSFLHDAHSTIVTSSVSSSAANIVPHLMLDNVNLSCDDLNMVNTNNQDVSYKEDHALNSKAANANNSWNSSINNYNAVAPFQQYNSNEGLTLNQNHNYLTTFDQSLDTVQRTIFTNSLQHYQELQTSPTHQQLQGYFQ